jgi:hypothetical protein
LSGGAGAWKPSDMNASFSYDPDGGGLCFRWECVEPATCTASTYIGQTVLQGAGKDKVSFGYYAIRFENGISDVAICQLYTHPAGPLQGLVLGQNGPSVGDVDAVECARLLEEYGIHETRIRLKVLIVKQAISNGQPTCDLVWPDNFGEQVSEFVDLTVVGEGQNDTMTRMQHGWLQPLVSIKPVDAVFNPSRFSMKCVLLL